MADDRNDSNNDRTAVPRTVSRMARRQDNPVTIHRWVWARILYPALGFPEVIGPSVEANRINGTTSIHLLLLADVDDLRPRDVAWQLRYAPLSKPVPRYLKPNTGVENRGSNGAAPCSFPENNIEVKKVTPGAAADPIEHADGTREHAGGQQVTFARGFIRANLSRYVLEFYKGLGMPHLYEVAIFEKSAARVPPGAYTLLWNNPRRQPTRKHCSYEMLLLSDYFYRERRALSRGPKKLPHPPREEYLFEHGEQQTTAHWVELLHPLFVRDRKPDEISVAHMTDPHVCVRADTFGERGKSIWEYADKPSATKFYNNYNRRFEELYPRARACDVTLLTGDIVDFGRGHDGKGKLGDLESYPLDRNWFLFYSLLAGKQRYTSPVYTVLGNHDWRQDPYGPVSPVYKINEDVQLNISELARAHGPGADAIIYGSTTNRSFTQRAAEWWPLLTSLDSVKWYLLLVNPFLDYVARHPGGFCFLMLDWAKEEKAISVEELGAILPVAKASISELQKSLVSWFFQLPEGAKSMGLHAGIVSPGPTDDALERGYIVPCPLCGGTRTNPHARILTDRGIGHGPRDCDCTRLMAQPAGDGEPSRLPYLAVNRESVAETAVPNECMPLRGTVKWHRDWLIKELMRHRVAAVFSGHAHRTTLLWVRQKPSDGFAGPALPAGTTMLVRSLPLGGEANPPVFVNTASAGPVGWRRPKGNVWIPERPGITVVRLRFDGAVLSARYESTSSPPLRARRTVNGKVMFVDTEYKVPSGYPDSNRPLAASNGQDDQR